MAKVKAPLFSFDARGNLAKLLTFRRRDRQNIAGAPTTHPDTKSPAQLSWRTMYEACSALWHTLSDVEKQAWETNARAKHMTGFALWQSQCLRPNPGIYLPLAGGTMSGAIDMATKKITGLPAPTLDPDAATKAYVDATGGLKIATLSLSRDTWLADEDIAYTGVGFTPKLLLFYSTNPGSNQGSWGFATHQTRQRCFYACWTTTGTHVSDDVVWSEDSSAMNGAEGWLLHIDTDGFTIGWYKFGSPAGTANFYVVCLA